jgi:tyrosine-protein kinase Etk/Wzc
MAMTQENLLSGAEKTDESETTFLDLLLVLAKRKRLIFLTTLTGALLALAFCFIVPSRYTGVTKILPPQQGQANSVSILGQLGALAGGGASTALGLKNPNDIYIAMLKSKRIANRLIERFKLMSLYESKFYMDAQKELEDNSKIVTGKDGIITISVEDLDPKRAAAMANAYVDELENLTLTLATTEASRRRLFFETRLREAKDNLALAEQTLQKYREENKVLSPELQGNLTISAAAALRAQISAKEIQIESLSGFATEQNADLIRLRHELAALKGELAKTQSHAVEGDVLLSLGKVPGVSIEYVRLIREMKYNETLFEILAKQYEIARLDESKNATLIQVLEQATSPERRSFPKRGAIISLATIASFFFALVLAFIMTGLQKSMQGTVEAEKWMQLRRLLSFGGR